MKLNKTQARRRGGAQTEDAGRYPAGAGLSVEGTSASLLRTKAQPKRVDLMEAVLERGNLMKAYERVLRNKGASGVDGIGVPEFKEHLKRHWPTIRARLLAGEYIPAPVRRVDIPKPQGGVRTLGIPTLTELDRKLECRGHRFCRYADDFNVYVKSEKAGHRLMAKLEAFLWTRLKLKVNSTKSAVARPWERQFLGYRVTGFKESRLSIAKGSRQRFADKVRVVLRKARGRSLARAIEALNPLLRGWAAYFRLARAKRPFLAIGRMDSTQAACYLVAAMETGLHASATLMKAGLSEVRAWTSATNGRGSVVEQRCLTHERGISEGLFCSSWTGIAARYSVSVAELAMNRRIRNRTYGGVGGRRK